MGLSRHRIDAKDSRGGCASLPGGFRGRSFQGHADTDLQHDPYRGELSEPERRAAEALFAKLRSAGIQPLRVAEYLANSGADRKTFDKATARLIKEGRLIRVDNEFVMERSAWDDLENRVRSSGVTGFTASDFGKAFGLSRKYSVPYLECLNRTGVLRRQGDRHVVVKR